MLFSKLLDLFSHDVLRVGLSAYADLLAAYRPLFHIAVALWALGISFEALTSESSFRPTVIKFVRGAVVIAYLTEPAVPRAFSQLLQAPAQTSGVVVDHIVDGAGGKADARGSNVRGNFGASMDRLVERVGLKCKGMLLKAAWGDDPLTLTVAKILVVFVLLLAFLSVVLYVAALATFYQAALLFLLPFAVTLYPWSYTRPLFDGVIRQGLSFSLVIPLLHALLALVISPLDRALDPIHGTLVMLIPFGCLCVVGSLLALQIPAVASGVAGGVGLPMLRLR